MTDKLFRNSSPGALTLQQSVVQAKKRLIARGLQMRKARELAAQGRGGDTEVAHVTPGEMVLPRELQSAKVLAAIQEAAAPYNVPLDMLSVGNVMNNINPSTGAPEFAFPFAEGFANWAAGLFGRDPDAAGSAPTVPEATGDYAHDFPGANAQLQSHDMTQPVDVDTNGLFNGPINVGPQPTNPAHVNAFFDAYDKPITALANDMNVPSNFLLGLASRESGWGQKNNLFGLSNATEQPYSYDKPAASIDAFRDSQWFSRLQNKTNVDDFLNALVDPKGGIGVYNPRKEYTDQIRDSIDTVNRRRPIWEQTR